MISLFLSILKTPSQPQFGERKTCQFSPGLSGTESVAAFFARPNPGSDPGRQGYGDFPARIAPFVAGSLVGGALEKFVEFLAAVELGDGFARIGSDLALDVAQAELLSARAGVGRPFKWNRRGLAS
ncbi:MAG: hypothetical protein LBF91_09630 [Azoarcus sp.]|jgi:hypothetical protein|nr:hypothetical protein [Azoarcus sp.]